MLLTTSALLQGAQTPLMSYEQIRPIISARVTLNQSWAPGMPEGVIYAGLAVC